MQIVNMLIAVVLSIFILLVTIRIVVMLTCSILILIVTKLIVVMLEYRYAGGPCAESHYV